MKLTNKIKAVYLPSGDRVLAAVAQRRAPNRRRKRTAHAVQQNSDRDEHLLCAEERAWSRGGKGRPEASGTSKAGVGHGEKGVFAANAALEEMNLRESDISLDTSQYDGYAN
jgi:hypothetical protein